jgi:hypothetical protein
MTHLLYSIIIWLKSWKFCTVQTIYTFSLSVFFFHYLNNVLFFKKIKICIITCRMSNILFCLLNTILSAQRSNYKCSNRWLNLEMHTFVLYLLFYKKFFQIVSKIHKISEAFFKMEFFQQSSNRLFP